MASEVLIYNMALSHINVLNQVSDKDEVSKQANECRKFYVTARDATLEAFNWPFAKRFALLAEVGTPPPTWIYQYAWPADAVEIREVVPVARSVDPIPFESAHSDISDSKVILTDEPAAQVEYTKRVTNTTLFSAAFTEALAARLVGFVAMPLTGKQEKVDSSIALFNMLIAHARANALNNKQEDPQRDASWHEDR